MAAELIDAYALKGRLQIRARETGRSRWRFIAAGSWRD